MGAGHGRLLPDTRPSSPQLDHRPRSATDGAQPSPDLAGGRRLPAATSACRLSRYTLLSSSTRRNPCCGEHGWRGGSCRSGGTWLFRAVPRHTAHRWYAAGSTRRTGRCQARPGRAHSPTIGPWRCERRRCGGWLPGRHLTASRSDRTDPLAGRAAVSSAAPPAVRAFNDRQLTRDLSDVCAHVEAARRGGRTADTSCSSWPLSPLSFEVRRNGSWRDSLRGWFAGRGAHHWP
jgi:hypothetical protein